MWQICVILAKHKKNIKSLWIFIKIVTIVINTIEDTILAVFIKLFCMHVFNYFISSMVSSALHLIFTAHTVTSTVRQGLLNQNYFVFFI